MQRTLLIAGLLALCACRTVTVVADGSNNPRRAPDHEQSYGFGLGGVIGETTIDVERICRGSKVTKMQAVSTVGDQLLGVITLGLYTPRTARVWCEE